MKKFVISALAVGAALSLFAFTEFKQETSQVIMIRGYIYAGLIGGKNMSTIKVYNGSTTEIVDLEKIWNKAGFDESMNAVIATVNNYVAQGYSVKSSTEVPGGSVVILNYTLSK